MAAEPPPTSRSTTRLQARWLARATFLLPAAWIVLVVWQVTAVPPPPGLSLAGEIRFGLDEGQRHDIAKEFAKKADAWRANSAKVFPKSPWSQEDHYYSQVFEFAGELAAKHRLQLAEVMFIYDEAVRLSWRGRGQKPLAATTRILSPRTE